MREELPHHDIFFESARIEIPPEERLNNIEEAMNHIRQEIDGLESLASKMGPSSHKEALINKAPSFGKKVKGLKDVLSLLETRERALLEEIKKGLENKIRGN